MPSAAVGVGRRVLVVEDNATNQKVILALLRSLGLETLLAENGEQGVEMFRHDDAIDLVLMDLHMPVMDGYEATQMIRQWERERGRSPRPIVALTADAFDAERERCQAVGMDDFLTKPISISALRTVLGAHLPVAAHGTESEGAHEERRSPGVIDERQVNTLLAQLFPMLENNKLDALPLFRRLRLLLGADDADETFVALQQLVDDLRFDAALGKLREIISERGWMANEKSTDNPGD